FSADLLAEVLERSQRARVPLHFDALGVETAERTLRHLASVPLAGPPLGCTLPGRWRRSLDDADRAIGLGLNVRVVKGEQPDAGRAEGDLRRGFLAVVNRLAGRARRVAIATHDVPLAREALRRLGDAGTPGGLELLFGLPARRLIGMGRAGAIPLRLYVPYGRPVLPYCLSQATERPAVMWWVTRDVLFRWRSREAAAATKE